MAIAFNHYLSWGTVVLRIAINHGNSPHPQPGPADTADRKRERKKKKGVSSVSWWGRRSQDACMKGLSCVRALPSRALITQ